MKKSLDRFALNLFDFLDCLGNVEVIVVLLDLTDGEVGIRTLVLLLLVGYCSRGRGNCVKHF